MSDQKNSIRAIVRKETATLVFLFLIGLVVLPVLVYLVGNIVFGAYDGSGFSAFYGALHSDFRAGEPVVWFLMLSPYIGWQILRFTVWGFRYPQHRDAPTE